MSDQDPDRCSRKQLFLSGFCFVGGACSCTVGCPPRGSPQPTATLYIYIYIVVSTSLLVIFTCAGREEGLKNNCAFLSEKVGHT